MGPDLENRVGDQEFGRPGRPVFVKLMLNVFKNVGSLVVFSP
jgi:hypothetical protein